MKLNPPIFELVIGIQFKKQIFNTEFVFDYYQAIKKDFPTIRENPVLPSIIESIESKTEAHISTEFNSRRLFISQEKDRIIQIQSDKLFFNWRRRNYSEYDYPQFSRVKNEFFIHVNNIQKLLGIDLYEQINQCEVTFVDNVFLNDFGLDIYKLPIFLRPITFNDPVKDINCRLIFPKPDINGNLILLIKSGINIVEEKKALYCETTCRGLPEDIRELDIWYDKSHLILLEIFKELFNENALKLWGLNDHKLST